MKTTYLVVTAPFPAGLIVNHQAEFCLVKQVGLESEVVVAYVPGQSQGTAEEMKPRFMDCAVTMNDETVPAPARHYTLSSLRLALGDLPRENAAPEDRSFRADFGRMDIGERRGSHGRGGVEGLW